MLETVVLHQQTPLRVWLHRLTRRIKSDCGGVGLQDMQSTGLVGYAHNAQLENTAWVMMLAAYRVLLGPIRLRWGPGRLKVVFRARPTSTLTQMELK